MTLYQRGQLAYHTHPTKFERRDHRRPSVLERIDRRLDALLRRADQSRILFA